MSTNLLLVGAGIMGFAMLKGWTEGRPAPAIHVVEPDGGRRARAARVAADLPISRVEALPPPGAVVVRCMPNTPAALAALSGGGGPRTAGRPWNEGDRRA